MQCGQFKRVSKAALYKFSLERQSPSPKREFVCIGNLRSLFGAHAPRLSCADKERCADLNLFFCYFFKLLCFQHRDGLELLSSFARHAHFRDATPADVAAALARAKAVRVPGETPLSKTPESADVSCLGARARAFLQNTQAFLRRHSFGALNTAEQLACLFFLVKRREFYFPPQCFCNVVFGCFLNRPSPKRRHDSIRHFLKVYFDHLLASVTRASNPRRPRKARLARFLSALKDGGASPGAVAFVASFLKGNFKVFSLKKNRPKSLARLFCILKANPATAAHFRADVFQKESAQLLEIYEKHRQSKIDAFLAKFAGKSLEAVFAKAILLLKKKRVKLFFSRKDVQQALNTVCALLNE